MIQFIKREPAMLVLAIESAIALATSYGLKLSGEQIAHIMIVACVILSIALRQVVTPTAKLPSGESK